MWTKRAIVEEAFAELALQGYVFDLTPEEMQTALRRLDTMLATWEAHGVRVGYAFGGDDLDAPSGLPDYAVEAAFLGLAVRLAPGFGKQLSSDTRRAANESYDYLLWAAAQPIQQQLPNTFARGAGNRIWRWSQRPFFPTPDSNPLTNPQGGDLGIAPE